MKTLKELRFNGISNSQFQKGMSIPLEYLDRSLNIDFDVYLPSIGKNLQRPFVWTLEQKRELIWSVLLERPIPALSFINRDSKNLPKNGALIEVIDGKQRLGALLSFYHNEFTIEIDGKEYLLQDLPKDYQSCFDRFWLEANQYVEIGETISDAAKIAWFKQINFVGTPQDKEHMDSLLTNL